MKAVILAAGRGSRLKHHTAKMPKCLTRVGGRPLLEWQIRALRGGGISDVYLIGGYRSDMLKPYGLPLLVNDRWPRTNMVRTLLCAGTMLCQEPFIISYSDILYPESIIQALRRHPGNIVISYDPNWQNLWEKRFSDPLEDAETFQITLDNTLADIGQKTDDITRIKGQYMGLLKITPIGWNRINSHLSGLSGSELDRLDMTGMLKQLVDKGIQIHVVKLESDWFEIDNEKDLQLCNQLLKSGRLNVL